MSGGYAPGFGATINTIDKFPFAVDSNSSDVGNLSSVRTSFSGPGQSSTTHGYVSGGYVPGAPGSGTVNTIDKFPFSTDTNATDIGDLSQARRFAVGQSSTTHGYTSGGNEPTPATKYNTIDKFPFASDTNATDVGDLSEVKGGPSGQSSTTSGYASGGTAGPGNSNVIDKFPFASDTNASDIGDLLAIIEQPGGQQARTIQ